MRFISILVSGALLAIILVSSLLYYYQESDYFYKQIQDLPPAIGSAFDNGLQEFQDQGLDPRWGIGIVLIVVITVGFLFGLQHKLPSLPSNVTLVFIAFILIFVLGAIATIYYWPDNTMKFGEFHLERGSQDKFAKTLEFIIIMVVDLHLIALLLFNFYHLLFWKNKYKEKG